MFASLTEWTLFPMVLGKILGYLCGVAALAFDFGLGKSWSVFSYEIIKKHRALGRAGQP